ncbi:hypothetical protein BOX15_Mlig024400g3 [Macrostomum lignano]|uniref:Uncharacterized protein n=1 Tax=Macrostomum lignano TaxID=282301 RepID=A0A267EAM8_9PLAT|nr:hypothetical protein BOX15_Mlig024400g3 [Macrostomum lignano]
MLNGRGQLSLSSPKRDSWSSSGDTSYYDARDQLTGDELEADEANAGRYNAALSVVDTSRDLQNAHDRATAYYDNTAYLHDNGPVATKSLASSDGTLKGTFYKKKKMFQRNKKNQLPAHLRAETNIDSTTTGGEDESAAPGVEVEETDDDFGFKYRPSIPPPRPLIQSAPSVGLTLEDTLSMKRSDRPATAAHPVGFPNGGAEIRSSGILLETNIDSELDDNSSIPSSYYPDQMKRPEQQSQQQLQSSHHDGQPGISQPYVRPPPAVVPMVPFHFNTAVREEDEDTDATAAVEDDDENSSGTTPAGFHEEVPRMASGSGWSPYSPVSPSGTVIENGVPQHKFAPSPFKSPAATSMTISAQSQAGRSPHQYPGPAPPRMMARLDTDFEVSSDEMDFTETTPGDMAILEYSRALEEAERMRHIAGGNYVFAKPPASQLTNSVPDFINYSGRYASNITGSVGIRAKSMNTLTASRSSLHSSGVSGKELLTPGRARRASLRRSRLGLEPGGGVYTIPVFDDSNPTLVSGNSQTNFAGPRHLPGEFDEPTVPEVQHHGPVRSSKQMSCLERCDNVCCPNTPRRLLVRYLLIAGICVCCVLLGVAVAVIVISTRPKTDNTSGA